MTNDEKPSSKFLTRKQAAAYLDSIGCPISAGALANMASNGNRGKGPPFHRIKWKIVRYRKSDLDAWAHSETVRVA